MDNNDNKGESMGLYIYARSGEDAQVGILGYWVEWVFGLGVLPFHKESVDLCISNWPMIIFVPVR